MPNEFRPGLSRYLSQDQLRLLQNTRVGIAGAGGLGSNAAMLLARCGVEKMIIIDHDTVESSNLNRQHYWPRHIGMPKVKALAESLLSLNPDMEITAIHQMLTAENMAELAPRAAVWLEALDMPACKKLVVEHALAAGCHVAAASGIAGFCGPPMRVKKMGKLTVVGDFESDIQDMPPLAPRVTQAAAMLADCALGFILNGRGSQES